jgi:hypothetical protein
VTNENFHQSSLQPDRDWNSETAEYDAIVLTVDSDSRCQKHTNRCKHRLEVNLATKFYDKNTNHQQMHTDSFIINRNTLLHVSTLLGHFQGELLCYRYAKVALYSWVRMCCWLCNALFLEAWTLRGPGLQAGTAQSSRVQYTVHSQQHILTQLKVQP